MLTINLANRAAAQAMQAYNSACMFGSIPLAATSSGLYLIGGYTDAGAAIPALIRSGAFDMATERLKRFRFFYFGLQASGNLKLSVICDGTEVATYDVNVADGGMREIRVPIGRAAVGRYWQWQVENQNGAFFVLYSVRALVVTL